MKNFRNCELFRTDEKNWNNFTFKECRNLSDFESWGIRKASDTIGMTSEKGHNCWYWSDGKFYQEYYKGNDRIGIYSLGISQNCNLIMEEYDTEWNKVAQYVVKLD